MTHQAPPTKVKPARKRGEPLLVFLMILLVWAFGRSALWEPVAWGQHAVGGLSLPSQTVAYGVPMGVQRLRLLPPVRHAVPTLLRRPAVPGPGWMAGGGLPHMALAGHPPAQAPPAMPPPMMVMPSGPPAPLPTVEVARLALPRPEPPAIASARLPMAAPFSRPTTLVEAGFVASGADARVEAVPSSPAPLPEPSVSGRRASGGRHWSGDGWAMLRPGGQGAGSAAGSLTPTYGASQIGAVLRYRLQPDDPNRLAVYARGYGALNGGGEKEVAAGISVRLHRKIPVAIMAEVRAGQPRAGVSARVRPAMMAVTELPPQALPGGFRAETYVQAGYVGGANETAFVDGQVRVDAPVDVQGRAMVRIGAGAWGGAQDGAARLDIGPTLRVAYAHGGVAGHVSVDWRVRVAGNAAPVDGPAITIAAGF
ncbi:hypothetical protein GTZ99_09375 [Novosphingobium sp. FSY-8]|uniref:Uncharacterized protein n=1 Tax=Novosphingobium ovatum TaxID=1908523 RepID=A0ABW9XE27_9SPHN|nr:hypothetical protein [Novosphingobium ovatum]NBC36765.1 hypothetical protein [Novosphingobium ovatum]